jgi:hypothetical protein
MNMGLSWSTVPSPAHTHSFPRTLAFAQRAGGEGEVDSRARGRALKTGLATES